MLIKAVMSALVTITKQFSVSEWRQTSQLPAFIVGEKVLLISIVLFLLEERVLLRTSNHCLNVIFH